MKTHSTTLALWLFTMVISFGSFAQEKVQRTICRTFGQLPEPVEKSIRFDTEQAGKRQTTTLSRPGDPNACSFYYVNIFYHFVRRTNGTGGKSTGLIGTLNSNLNNALAAHSIRVSSLGFDEILDDNYYNFDDSKFNSLVYSSYSRSEAINIYLLDDDVYDAGRAIIGGNALVIGGAYRLGGVTQYLVPSLTLAHELGHCLGLYHTFETLFGNELVNGSNCTAAGDLVCDTPAESPLFAFEENASCAYTTTRTDANGDTYAPDPHNIMNYVRPSQLLY